jgi:hypothetical protein
MRAPKRKRVFKREMLSKEQLSQLKTELLNASSLAKYVGSVEHKKSPSFAGQPRPRADASICPDYLAKKQGKVTGWLKEAIRKGSVSNWWEGNFPRYVWYKSENTVFEARLINKVNGEYKGWPLNHNEWPDQIVDFYA